jgi:glycosyltransferase involved in cell wall biosynthesis
MFHANLAGRLLRLLMPFPVVISTLHSVAESSRRSEKTRLRDWWYRATDALADVTVAVSHAVAERHRNARAVPHARVIPNGVDTGRFRADADVRARMRRELAVEGEFVWIAVGRLMWKKNYPALLAAFGQLGHGTLLIAGAGPQELELKKAAPPGVRFLGEREDVADLLNAADAFVLASIVEGLPVALLEAAATGLPCVATDAGGVRETGVGLVCAPEPGTLAACMRSVAEMSAEDRSRLGDDARRQVLARYSLDVVVSQWEDLYRTLTASM